jgi:nucleoside-diphosphate-sugar epimerase
MKVVVIGATGFTGSYVVPLLLKRGAQVCCLVRETSDRSNIKVDQCTVSIGDLSDRASLRRAFDGAEILINLASLGFGHAGNVVAAAAESGIQRAVFVSTTAIFTTLNPQSKSVRLAAEEAIRSSDLAYTILRPTMIYGSSRDRNISRLIRYLYRWPVIPIFGSGESLQQPVFVGDVAAAVVQCVDHDKSVGHAYNVPGAEPLSFNQVIDTICRLIQRKVRKVHFPAAPIVASLETIERLPLRLPIKAEQVRRLNEDKAFDYVDAERDFGYHPRSFQDGIRLQLQEMARKE